jgi:hypothetical protein
MLDLLVLVTAAALIGALVFFPVVVAPALFGGLDAADAGRALRRLFPRYYLFGTALAAVTTAFAVGAGLTVVAILAAAVVLGFVVSREVLTPRINAARDRADAGDAASETTFRRLHGTSVAINLAQLTTLVVIVALAA